MRTIEQKIYKFQELSDEVKQKVIDKWYKQEDYLFLNDDLLKELKQIDEDGIFSEVKLCYSLSYCQGDGLSFSSVIDLRKFLNRQYSKKLKESQVNAICEMIYKVYSKSNNGHYCYCSKNDILFDYNEPSREFKNLDELWYDNILPEIVNYYLETCRKLEKCGYDILDYRMDFKEFAEHAECNGYEYFSDGKMY